MIILFLLLPGILLLAFLIIAPIVLLKQFPRAMKQAKLKQEFLEKSVKALDAAEAAKNQTPASPTVPISPNPQPAAQPETTTPPSIAS
jgi:hypothetical protein